MDVLYLIKKEGLRRGLSHRTIVTYCYCVKNFLKKCKKDPKYITKKDIFDYMDYYIENGYCGNTMNVNLSALKFLFQEILGKRLLYHVRYSKTPKSLPTVLTQNETKRLFDSINNKKHKLMIELMYSAGLRVGELVNLRSRDFEFENNYGWVRNGKGNKDRMFMIAVKIKEKLKDFIPDKDYENFIFKGRSGHISKKTIYEIVKTAAKSAKIKKNVHPHTLRHSFATHLIENGYDVASVQSLLGHNSPETTMRYVHMVPRKMICVKSPFDEL
ncbi:MAG: tyrosine-type recombinase/integrase [Nanoarchaeota archaeon]|nr:tyrosine-type recombinase/integrase [Nanoarchaeota archaeon]